MLTQQIKQDMMAAMKAREQLKVDTLRGAMTAFTNELVAKGRKPTEELDDAGAVVVLKRLAKQRKDASEQYERGGRPERVRCVPGVDRGLLDLVTRDGARGRRLSPPRPARRRVSHLIERVE